MKRFKNHLIVAAVLSVLAVIGTIMNSPKAAAQGPPGGLAVNIVNPLPVPVTGSTTVSGSVRITGTPDVNVTNPATAPVLFLNVNDPGRIPYQSLQVCSNNVGSLDACTALFPTVPSNHRLVIQHVSISTSLSTASTAVIVVLTRDGLASGRFSEFPAMPIPGGNGNIPSAVVDQPVLGYIDQGHSVDVTVVVTSGNAPSGDVALTGYMLDCTIAPCAAIAQ